MAVSDCAASYSGSAQRSRWRSADSKRAKAIYFLGASAQASIQHRHGTLSELPGQANHHRRHRRSIDHCEDSQAPGLAGTSAASGTGQESRFLRIHRVRRVRVKPPPTLIAAPSDDQRTRSVSSTKTAVGCRQKQLFAPRSCPTKLKNTSSNLLGRPFSAFSGVGFTENGCGFLEKGGL